MVPDNAKTGVTKACRYDPDLNPTYQEMAMHYGVGVVPARVPTSRAIRPRWRIWRAARRAFLDHQAALRHQKFFWESGGAETTPSASCATKYQKISPAAVPQTRRLADINTSSLLSTSQC